MGNSGSSARKPSTGTEQKPAFPPIPRDFRTSLLGSSLPKPKIDRQIFRPTKTEFTYKPRETTIVPAQTSQRLDYHNITLTRPNYRNVIPARTSYGHLGITQFKPIARDPFIPKDPLEIKREYELCQDRLLMRPSDLEYHNKRRQQLVLDHQAKLNRLEDEALNARLEREK